MKSGFTSPISRCCLGPQGALVHQELQQKAQARHCTEDSPPEGYTQKGSPCLGSQCLHCTVERGLWLWGSPQPLLFWYVSNSTISIKWGMDESPSSGGALLYAVC